MIELKLHTNPGFPATNPEYLGFIKQWYKPAIPGKDCAHYWATASVNCDYRSTLEVRRYLCGLEPPNFPVPALRCRTFEYWRNLGEVSALNIFDIEVVQRLNRYR